MVDNVGVHVFHVATHTHGAKVRLFTPLCDVRRTAGDRTDEVWYHSSHQDMEPISPTLRNGCLFSRHAHNFFSSNPFLTSCLFVSLSPYRSFNLQYDLIKLW